MEKYKNIAGEIINTKDGIIKLLIHTANYEQIHIEDIWCFDEAIKEYDIDKTKFYWQPMCERCSELGISICHYKDDEFEYRYNYNCEDCLKLQ